MNDPYNVLGIGRDASIEEVKKRYRELTVKYHPDKYAGNELSDLAAEKMKKINEAYDAIIREREGRGGPRQQYHGNPPPHGHYGGHYSGGRHHHHHHHPYNQPPSSGGGCGCCECCAGLMCADCLCSACRCC